MHSRSTFKLESLTYCRCDRVVQAIDYSTCIGQSYLSLDGRHAVTGLKMLSRPRPQAIMIKDTIHPYHLRKLSVGHLPIYRPISLYAGDICAWPHCVQSGEETNLVSISYCLTYSLNSSLSCLFTLLYITVFERKQLRYFA